MRRRRLFVRVPVEPVEDAPGCDDDDPQRSSRTGAAALALTAWLVVHYVVPWIPDRVRGITHVGEPREPRAPLDEQFVVRARPLKVTYTPSASESAEGRRFRADGPGVQGVRFRTSHY